MHGGAREGAGRPPKYGKVPLRPCVFRILPDEYKSWKRAAKESGKPLNTWVRDTLNDASSKAH